MSPTPLGCDRCRAYASLTRLGVLWLCAACTRTGLPAGCTRPHAWRGGWETWVCDRCGATLPLVAPPAPPPAPVVPPTDDWWC